MHKNKRSAFVFSFMLLTTMFSFGCSDKKSSTDLEVVTTAVESVLTTDVGAEIDDQWAMAHLLLSPEISLRAIITTHASSIGFTSAESTQEAKSVLAQVRPKSQSKDPTVATGSNLPLADAFTPQENAGVDLLIHISQEFSKQQRLVVFITGAATDVASAILKDPSIVDRVLVVAMAFNDYPGGGEEFNVRNDPFAYQVILDSDIPLIVGSSVLTKQALRLTRGEAESLMSVHGEIGKYLHSLFSGWLDKESSLVAQIVAPDTWVIWDEVVVAYVLGMARGKEVQRPRLQISDLSFSLEETERRMTWLTEIDVDLVWEDFTQKVNLQAQTK